MELEMTKKELAQIAGYMDDYVLFIRGKENAWRAYRAIEEFLRDRLALDVSPKSRVQKATAPVEFVGYLITPHGMRLRKKTTKHVKRSLTRIMDAYAAWEIDYDQAMESAMCYAGMCRHGNGRNLLRWIEENFVLTRGEAR